MTEFYLYAAILILLGCVFVVLPFMRKDTLVSVDPGTNAERIDIYHQRLTELAAEQQDNRISEEGYQQAIVELKKRLLNELAPEKQFNLKGNNLVLASVGTLFLLSFSIIFYGISGSHKQQQSWLDAIEKLPELGQRAVMQTGEPLTPNELQQFALGLRTKLSTNGDDQVAWMLLGRVAMSLNDLSMATQAFEKSLKINPDNVNVMLAYSQALLVDGSEESINKAAKKLSKILQQNPTNMDAISLLALIAYERKDWLEAKTAFELLLSSMEKADPRYVLIEQRINELNQRLNVSAEGDINKNSQSMALQPRQLTVKLSLSDDLVNNVPKGATLFVFAKAAQGPQMPLAVVKLTSVDLPTTVVLSQDNAMMPSLTMEQFDQVIVTARISIDDKVDVQVGELQGQSAVIDLTTKTELSLTINQLIQ
ncbi:c-type cytochrome biogenesis protein CcmI [Pseudoalteromonas ulvae]|uniref:C-type cytochrome biogenesis protein CcmI n=1 Tax=Pseudoalteromonas ulvae TaxID=107327 RepID=A0A244CTG9_PSEDV|nr:c-type cytochrome biogenesis protein CcmI [Pseudoalteromonas ulvae]OUL58529.1 c-type cytochrome biogenesis protein CcmI [Pseudoalteromonas ulvae]